MPFSATALTFTIVLSMSLGLARAGFAYKAEWIDFKASNPSSATPATSIDPKRSGHVSFQFDKDTFVFGGYAEEEALQEGEMPNRFVVNDLWKWTKTGWIQQDHVAGAPNPRLVSAAAVVNGKPTIFGGWDPETAGTGGTILQDICQLDVDKMEWKRLDLTLGQPTSRHVAAALSDTTVLIHTHRCLDHVFLFQEQPGSGPPTLTKQPTTGEAPSSRGLHAACMLGNDKFIVFGGAAQDGNMSNKVYCLDTTSWNWNEVNVGSKGDCPSPRAAPCMCVLDNDSLLVFGGAQVKEGGGLQGCGDLWLLQFDNDNNRQEAKWTLLLKDGPPAARNAATLNHIQYGDDENTSHFVLQGGWEPFQKTWDDVFLLRVTKDS